MAISENKKRVSISIDKDLYKVLQEYAKKNKRTVSGEIELYIENHILPLKENSKE